MREAVLNGVVPNIKAASEGKGRSGYILVAEKHFAYGG